MPDIEAAREAFLNLIADASVFEEQLDADADNRGRLIDCTTYKIVTGHRQLAELLDALDIRRGHGQSPMDALCKAIADGANG